MSLILFLVSLAFAACPADAESTWLDAMTASEIAFTEVRMEEFARKARRAEALVGCLERPLSQPEAARVHRLGGIRALVDGDRDGAILAFSAAWSLEPAFVFPDEVAPPGSPVAEAYAEARPGASDVPIEPARGGSWYIDGSVALARPADLPTVAQLVDREGLVRVGAYLHPGEPLPEYATRYRLLEPGSGVQKGLLGATATSAGVSVLLLGLAAGAEARYWDSGTADADLPAIRRRTNTLVASSAVTGVAALGLGIGFVAVRF